MTAIQTLYAALIALGFLISLSVALTLSIEGAGILYMRDQVRLMLERSRVLSPTMTPSAGAAQLPVPAEEADVIVLR